MTKSLRFYNRDGRWYADVPETILWGGTEENNEMVAGADTWLDIISKGEDNIILKISNDEELDEKLERVDDEEDNHLGASYIAKQYQGKDWNYGFVR